MIIMLYTLYDRKVLVTDKREFREHTLPELQSLR